MEFLTFALLYSDSRRPCVNVRSLAPPRLEQMTIKRCHPLHCAPIRTTDDSMLSRSLGVVLIVLAIATVHLVTSDTEGDDYEGGTIDGMDDPLDSVVSKRFSFRIPWKWAVYGGGGGPLWSRYVKTNNFD